MTTHDSIAPSDAPSKIVALRDYREPLANIAIESRQSADRLRAMVEKLGASVAAQPSSVSAAVVDDARKLRYERDDAATKKAVAKERRTLRDRLPAVADELQRLSTAIRDGHASLKDESALDSLAVVFESILNRGGSKIGEDECYDISEAIDLARGTAYVQRDGDVAYDRGAEAAS